MTNENTPGIIYSFKTVSDGLKKSCNLTVICPEMSDDRNTPVKTCERESDVFIYFPEIECDWDGVMLHDQYLSFCYEHYYLLQGQIMYRKGLANNNIHLFYKEDCYLLELM